MSRAAARLGAAAWLLCGCVAPAFARPPDAAGEEPAKAAFEARLQLDNDDFDFWIPPDERPDFGYTHGTRLDVDLPGAPRWLRKLPPRWLMGDGPRGEAPSFALRLRQEIYAPWELPPDRPYAGWLEIAVGLARRSPESRRELLLHVGVTGPPSLAGKTQDYFHHQFERGPEPDWSQQLPAEPGIGLEWNAATQVLALGGNPGWLWRLGPSAGARLGTFAIDARAGLETSGGWNPPAAWGGAVRPGNAFSLYVLAAPHVDFIARDEFLDGTLFRGSESVDSRPVVPESEVGVGVGWFGIRAEARVMRRGKEFERQPGPHTYGSLRLGYGQPAAPDPRP